MSYGAEMETEFVIERELAYSLAARRAEQGVWETMGGETIRVQDMTNKHIAYALAMLKRSGSPYADPYIVMFEKERERRANG